MRDLDPGTLSREMRQQFEVAGYKKTEGSFFPFNAGPDDFQLEAALGLSHTNPDRVSWVREHLL